MFLDVWSGKYTPSAKDFLMGSIKSNNPMLLKEFVAAFKKWLTPGRLGPRPSRFAERRSSVVRPSPATRSLHGQRVAQRERPS